MNRRIAAATSGALVIGGVLVAIIPQHATSIARLAAATVAVFTGGLVLAAVGPIVARDPERTALDHLPATGATPLDPHGLRDARRDLDRPSAPGALPPAVRDRLLDLHAARAGRSDAIPDLLQVVPSSAGNRDPAAVAVLVHDVLDQLDAHAPRSGATDGNH